MLGRLALVAALALAAWAPSAVAGCPQVVCSYDAKAGPGDCYSSSSRYAEDRGDNVDAAGAASARIDNRCSAWGSPPTHLARIIELDAAVPGLATGSLVWSSSDATCTMALDAQVAFLAPAHETLGCIASPPWIYQPIPGISPLV